MTPYTHAVQFETQEGSELVEFEEPMGAAMLYASLLELTKRPMKLYINGKLIEQRGWLH